MRRAQPGPHTRVGAAPPRTIVAKIDISSQNRLTRVLELAIEGFAALGECFVLHGSGESDYLLCERTQPLPRTDAT